jgi:anthranilate synthase component 1
VRTFRDGTTETFTGNPFDLLADCLAPIHPVHWPELPPSLPGVVGFWGYELIRWIEPKVPVYAVDGAATPIPDGLWMQVDTALVFDRVKRRIWAIAYADVRDTPPDLAYQQAQARLGELTAKLRSPLPAVLTATVPVAAPKDIAIESNTTAAQFQANVERAKEYIRNGDIFQVVLSQRLGTPFTGDPFRLYRALCSINPSPYMAYFHFDRWQMVGGSPEIMVKAEAGDGRRKAIVRPIAGTRPRGSTPEADRAYEEALLADPKERAEHVMLVDLGRNDLGRVCRHVRPTDFMAIERYSHVMHIVSQVEGELAPEHTPWDLLQATFPAGTVSGAPKIRAMEIIHELEGERRGPYAGAYGFYDFAGQLNTAIAIRTVVVRDGWATVQAGAGIVADSDPAAEYQETLNKARGMMEALRYLE